MMGPEEILVEFRRAKDKAEQINILADLNAVSPRAIAKIIDEAGELKPEGLSVDDFSPRYNPVPPASSRAGQKLTFDEERALQMLADGISFRDMAQALGVSNPALRKWAARRGLKRETPKSERKPKGVNNLTAPETDEPMGITVGELSDFLQYASHDALVKVGDKPVRFIESTFFREAGGKIVHVVRLEAY